MRLHFCFNLRFLIRISFSLYLCQGNFTAQGLECDWIWTRGKFVATATGFGTRVDAVPTRDECQNLCLSRSDFLCHSVMYRGDVSNGRCLMFAENLQTAEIVSDERFSFAIRPSCAGIWFPWTTEKGMILSNGGSFINTTIYANERVQNCMTECLQTNSNGNNSNCRSIVVGFVGSSPGVCERWDAREGDPGRVLEESEDRLTINRPHLYMDDSPSATDLSVEDRGSGSFSPQLFTSTKLPVSGYLIAWQYYIPTNRTGSLGCYTFADIWKERIENSTKHWTLISKTQLTGDNSTSGVKFQYVSDRVVRVEKNDFVGAHISLASTGVNGKPVGCRGSLVSFSNSSGHNGQYILLMYYEFRDRIRNLANGSMFNSSERAANQVRREPSIKAFISPYCQIELAPVVVREQDSIKISWKNVSEDIGLAGYRLSCSQTADFITSSSCGDALITGTQTTLSSADIFSNEPLYARVQVVRNVLGKEEPDLLYSPSSHFFCTAHNRSLQQIELREGRLRPGELLAVSLSVYGIQQYDPCLEKVRFVYTNQDTINQSRTDFRDKGEASDVFMEQGITYTLQIQLQLQDGYEFYSGRTKSHTASKAPPAPQSFTAKEDSITGLSSLLLSWSIVEFTSRTITGYQVSCEPVDLTLNPEAQNSVSISNLVDPSLTKTIFIDFPPLVQYACFVRVEIENGFGEKAALVLWTKLPALNISWTNETSAVDVMNGTVTVQLPRVQQPHLFRYLQIKAQDLLNGQSTILVELDLNTYGRTEFTIGDYQLYGGLYRNLPLSPGIYRLSVGFRPGNEQSASEFRVIPGAAELTIGEPLSPSSEKISLPAYILYAIIGAVSIAVLLVISISVIVVKLRRRRACNRTGKENSNDKKGRHLEGNTQREGKKIEEGISGGYLEMTAANPYEEITDVTCQYENLPDASGF